MEEARLVTTAKQRVDEATRALRLASTITQGCCHCAWTLTDTLERAKAEFTQHRKTAHPELPPPRPRIKLKPGGWQTGAKRIDENVAGARAQGAGGKAA